MRPIDLDAIRSEWLTMCGSCDAGLPTACVCAAGDPRTLILRLTDALIEARELIDDLIDDEICWFDPHGECQEHDYLEFSHGERCPNQIAKDFLAQVTVGAK